MRERKMPLALVLDTEIGLVIRYHCNEMMTHELLKIVYFKKTKRDRNQFGHCMTEY
jgi:hypothetical protein